VEEKKISSLKRELKVKESQFNSIFEFSESIYSSFHAEGIFRIYFSTLMGQLGISRIFYYDSEHLLLKKRGFLAKPGEEQSFFESIKQIGGQWFWLRVEDMATDLAPLREFLVEKKIAHLVKIAENENKKVILGLGEPLNKKEITTENIEYAFFVSKFAASAVDNTYLINKLLETQRMEHEFKIARDIQLSLLPQSLPKLDHFELSVLYEPIHEVGGDYYDVLKYRKDELPILIADVEGKGLSAALLAASSQSVFRSLNEIYFFEPSKFIAKANELMCGVTRGTRFITVFWMLINDATRSATYVNAGHVDPIFYSPRLDKVTRLSTGGLLTGFSEVAQYEKETLLLEPGDIILAFTDGVPEVENPAGEEFGVDRLIDFLRENHHLCACDLTTLLFNTIMEFSQKKKFRDDFTVIMLKTL